MNPVEKALWFVESHYGNERVLADIALASGESRFHLTRMFSAATGRSVMEYVRGCRLSEAAKALSNGARDILSIAVEAGYNSHEAFTRASRNEFGLTPERVRAGRLPGDFAGRANQNAGRTADPARFSPNCEESDC
jgi:AraC family transcriptional regulator